jgi:hypothetical protein
MAFGTIALASGAGTVRARQARPGGAPISIEFRAIAEDGRPVLDLKAEELALRIGGRDKKVASLQLVQLAGGKTAAAPAPVVVLPAPFATNVVPHASRSLLIALADESVPPGREQPVRDAIGQMLAGLAPADQVGLMATPRGGTLVDATTQHASVTGALTKFVGRKSLGESTTDAACRTRDTLDGLKGLFANLEGGASTAVVFVSFGMTAPGSGTGQCAITTASFQDLAPPVAGSRATFFVVHIMDGGPDNAGLNNLASTTGGELIRYTGQNETAMARIALETSAYYVLSFDAEPADRTGANQRVELRIPARERVRVQARQSVLIPKSAAAPTPRDMIRQVRPYRDLPLRANAYLSPMVGENRLKTIVLFEPAEPGATLTAASVVLFNEKGQGVSQWNGQDSDLSRALVMAAPGPPLPPGGTYRLRVAATDATGRAGAVDLEVKAELAAVGPGRLSTMSLGTIDNGFVPRLQFGPADQAALGYLEIYGIADAATVTAKYELAASIDAAPIATGDGKVAAGKDVLIVSGGFGIAPLPPGDYILRVIISIGGKEAARTSRTLRKVAQ